MPTILTYNGQPLDYGNIPTLSSRSTTAGAIQIQVEPNLPRYHQAGRVRIRRKK